MRRAFSYIRWSSSDQTDGDSLRRQRDMRDERCQREGWVLDESTNMVDAGYSAFTGENVRCGALAAFLEAIRVGTVPPGSVLIVERLDRLSRQDLDTAHDLFKSIVRAGVDVATLSPERLYTRDSLKTLLGSIEPLLLLYLAHEESLGKSKRLRSMWEDKRSKAADRPQSRTCPAWLRLNEERTAYVEVPEAVAAVRRLFSLAEAGYGVKRIARVLRDENVPPIGKQTAYWRTGYIGLTLRNRAVLGEYQPHRREGKRRVPAGPVLTGYYPAIVSQAQFDRVRAEMTRRRKSTGRVSNVVSNLFGGLLRSAADGQTMTRVVKAGRRNIAYLCGAGSAQETSNGAAASIPYDDFESALLHWLDREDLHQLVARPADAQAPAVAAAADELTQVDALIQKTKARLRTSPDSDALLDVLLDAEGRRRVLMETLERLRQDALHKPSETLGEARSLVRLLAQADEKERVDLRTRLRSKLQALIAEAWVLIDGWAMSKYATVQVFFRSGGWSMFTFAQKRDHRRARAVPLSVTMGRGGPTLATLPADDDLRTWRSRPDRKRYSRPTGVVEGPGMRQFRKRLSDQKGAEQ